MIEFASGLTVLRAGNAPASWNFRCVACYGSRRGSARSRPSWNRVIAVSPDEVADLAGRAGDGEGSRAEARVPMVALYGLCAYGSRANLQAA